MYSDAGSQNVHLDRGMMTRSGRSIVSPNSPLGASRNAVSTNKVRVIKEPRTRRRAKQAKTEKNASPTITAPLSELTKNMVHIPIRDMEAWVNRPIEQRRREVQQKNGKIARPMNSFMLYRSAYAERTKEWCAQNNHQVVSRASGQSWPLEPKEIREKFEYLALIERDNHQKAHPEYKFAPNKSQTPPRKKRNNDYASNVDEAEFDIPETSHPLSKRARSSEVDSCYESRESTPLDSQGSILSENFGQSDWPMSHPPQHVSNQSLPGLMSPMEAPSFYYPQHGRPSSATVRSHPDDSSIANDGTFDSSGTTLVGVPGGTHQDLLRSYSGTAAATSQPAGHMDPQLLPVDHNGNNNYGLWQADNELGGFAPVPNQLATGSVFDPMPSYTSVAADDGTTTWNVPVDQGVGEAGKEFDQWLNSQAAAF